MDNMPVLRVPTDCGFKERNYSSINLPSCLTVGQINLYGDEQTIKYMATLSDMATLAVHKP